MSQEKLHLKIPTTYNRESSKDNSDNSKNKKLSILIKMKMMNTFCVNFRTYIIKIDISDHHTNLTYVPSISRVKALESEFAYFRILNTVILQQTNEMRQVGAFFIGSL